MALGASSVRGTPMTASASATAIFLRIPTYDYYFPPPFPPYRRLFLYHGFTSGFLTARCLDVRVSSLGKSRKKKKKSDSELCEEIREFLVSAGLPESHVPSIKELFEHGRSDLANIVRRRGYKVITELLLFQGVETYDGVNNFDKNKEGRSQEEETVGGYVEEEFSGKTSLDLPGNTVNSRRDQTLSAEESSRKDEAPPERGDENENVFPFGLSRKEEDCSSLNQDVVLGFSVASHVPEEISTDEALKRIAETETGPPTSTARSSVQENLSGLSKSHSASVAEIAYGKDIVSSVTSSLDERVTKFMQSGYLDPVEEYVMDGQLKTPKKELMSSEVLVELHRINARQDQKSDDVACDGNLTSERCVESPSQEKQSDVKHLKQMLHQKELELSQLKEQIQKEKNALELIQIKAENEISKAQKRIWEKDAELQAAEDSLAGLQEVQIEYQGDGDTVEVAGSFNGWQGRIPMDPQPSDSSTDSIGSRRPSLWSTTLWLYPGKYEIKFVVDGHWMVDPQKESATRGTIVNNILRVEG